MRAEHDRHETSIQLSPATRPARRDHRFRGVGHGRPPSFAALAVDLGYLYVVRNELQNAADAGALAGAQVLLTTERLSTRMRKEMAELYVRNNFSEKAPVTVESVSAAIGVSRGLPARSTANDSLDVVHLWDVSTQELDENTNFINAVQVVTRRTAVGVRLPSTSSRGSLGLRRRNSEQSQWRTSDSPGHSRQPMRSNRSPYARSQYGTTQENTHAASAA